MLSTFLFSGLRFAALLCSSIVQAAGPMINSRDAFFATSMTTREEFAARSDSVLPEGYKWSDLKFNGTIRGIDVRMEGTVDQIFSRFYASNPEIKFNLETRSPALDITKRNKDGTHCCPVAGHSWSWVHVNELAGQLKHLRELNGACEVSARSCVRLSCLEAASIFLCNDNFYDIAPNCGYVASYAQDIIDQCSWTDARPGIINPYTFTCGQEFDTDQYNIVVTGQHCWINSHKGPDYHGWW